MSNTTIRLDAIRILIVEDELVIAIELENLLRRLGYAVLGPAPTIRHALDALAGERPDAAVLDVNLRGERATPVAEALREQGTPFVLTTGYGRERLPEEALQDAPYLAKPVEPRQLATVLTEVLARSRRG